MLLAAEADLISRALHCNSHEHALCARVGASYIVNVVRCNERYAAPTGDLKQCAVDLLLLRHSVILKLEIEAVLTEDIAQPLRLAQRAVEIRCEYHRRNYSTETSG